MGIRIENNVSRLDGASNLQSSTDSLAASLAKLGAGLQIQPASHVEMGLLKLELPELAPLTYTRSGEPGLEEPTSSDQAADTPDHRLDLFG